MAEQAKKIVSVEIPNLKEQGFGPEGKHTRETWRAECFENLLAGKEQFEAWQQSWLSKAENAPLSNYGVVIHYEDGTSEQKYVYDEGLSLDFIGHRFENWVVCSSYRFLIEACFDVAYFHGGAWFESAHFARDARFESAHFAGPAEFCSAHFAEDVWFSHAYISGSAGFASAHFECNAGFESVCFAEYALFNRATFGDMWFSEANFHNISDFSLVLFSGVAVFENVVFKNVGHFEGAIFLGDIPAFRGCKIDNTRLEFSDESHFLQEDFSEDAIKNISFLKRLSDEHGQVDQALNFNAMELRAKRKNTWQTLSPDKAWLNLLSLWPLNQIFIDSLWKMLVWLSVIFSGQFWFCVFTYLYEKVSDFGRSFTSPLRYLVFIMLLSYLFGVVSAFENSPAKASHSRQPIFEELARVYDYNQPNKLEEYLKISGYRAATEYSLYRSGNFLDFTDADKNTASINMRLFGSEIEPWWARVFGFFKGIITAILLFLIALGLRNKYRVS